MSERRYRKPTKYDLETWNAMYPSGSPCILTDDFGREHKTNTRSIAWELGHGEAVVKVEGRSGGYMLDRIRMLETHTSKPEATQ